MVNKVLTADFLFYPLQKISQLTANSPRFSEVNNVRGKISIFFCKVIAVVLIVRPAQTESAFFVVFSNLVRNI